MATPDLSQLTAIIPAGPDRKSVTRVVRSCKRCYPKLQLLLAAEDTDFPLRGQGQSIRLPAGAGWAAACNAMLARLRTPYFLLLDDRCEIDKLSQLEHLLELVASDKLDVAAGDLTHCTRLMWFFVRRRPQQGHGILELAGDQLTLEPGHRAQGEGYLWCDLVHHFFVARTEKVRALGGWDHELKNDGREEFFVRAHRKGLRVGIVPEVKARYWEAKQSTEIAGRYPDRKSLAVAKMGLSRMTDLEGRVVKAPRRAAAA